MFARAFFLLLLLLLAGCRTPGGRPLPPAVRPTLPPSPAPTATEVVVTRVSASPTPAASPAAVATATPVAETATAAAPAPTMAPALPGTAQGFELVGHAALGGIGWHAGLALHGHCAYVGNRRAQALTIVDVSEPQQPRLLPPLPLDGGQPVEIRTLPGRDVLLVADFRRARLLTYDVSECARPQPLGALALPAAPHEFYLWHDGEQVLAYLAMFDHAPPDLIVADLSDPAAPREVARWTAPVDGLLHSLSLTDDGRHAYLALWDGGFLAADVDPPQLAPVAGAAGALQPAPFAATHSAVHLADPRYVLLTAERYTCPFAGVAVADVADPARPTIVARLALPENRCDELPAADAVFTAHNPLVAGDLVFVSWYAGGVQVLEVADPAAPRRVAQFVPAGTGAAPFSYVGSYPVQTWSYPILRDGLLYVADIQSGLYVLRYTGPGAEAVAAARHAEGNVRVGD